MTSKPLLEIHGLSKIFGQIPVVERIDLSIAAGEIVMVIGPSGAGKSTLLRCVNRIEIPSEGGVMLDGVDMAGEMRNGRLVPDRPTVTAQKRRHIGMVFQRFNLFAHLTALDPELVGEVLEVIRALAQNGMTMLVVTHEMQFAREVGTRILFMDSGRILEDAAPGAFFARPEQLRAREFLRRIHAPGAG